MTLASWKTVEAELARLSAQPLKITARRASLDNFIWKAPHLEADVAKQFIDEGVMSAMQAVAAERNLPGKIRALFAGDIMNASENRPALHWALRGNGHGIPAADAMYREADKAAAFARQ